MPNIMGYEWPNIYPTERERLIESGKIYPLEARPTLRMDAAAREGVIRHLRQYFLEPEKYQETFWFQDSAVMP